MQAPIAAVPISVMPSCMMSGVRRPFSRLAAIAWSSRYGTDLLPDPITNGPFVGARNPFGPIDFVAPDALR